MNLTPTRRRQHPTFGDRCVFCRRLMGARGTVDHVLPLASGGEDCRSNLVDACGACNSAKGNGLVEGFEMGPAADRAQRFRTFLRAVATTREPQIVIVFPSGKRKSLPIARGER